MFDTPTLLIVDDEGGICRACRRILKQAGFRVHVSRDARVGLGSAADKERFQAEDEEAGKDGHGGGFRRGRGV